MSEIFTGFESLARGVIDAGAKFAASYPGGPSTKVVETLIAWSDRHEVYVEWANNEKVAFEEVLGCSLAGVRAVMIAKHVGINHIMDPLLTANLTGVGGGLVILAGDDPGAYSSQNEQDSRLLGAMAEIPILEPADPEQGYLMVREAFRLSENFRIPVMVRFVTDYCIEKGPVVPAPPDPPARPKFNSRVRWKALPATTVKDHAALHIKLRDLPRAFNRPPYKAFNRVAAKGGLGVTACGHVAAKVRQFPLPAEVGLLELGTIHPLPEEAVLEFLKPLHRVYVLEEVEPFMENQIRILAQRNRLDLEILGKTTGHVPWEGDLDRKKLGRFWAEEVHEKPPAASGPSQQYPGRPPLGDGCPYEPFFTTLKQMAAEGRLEKPIVVGETGCLVRLDSPPLEMLDVKYSMGSSVGLACGLWRSGVENKIMAVTGDSAFMHTGLPGLVNAAHHRADIIVVVMDNGTVAKTGFQERTGAGVTAMKETVRPIVLEKVAEALNIDYVRVVDAFDLRAIEQVLEEIFSRPGPSFLVVRGACPYTETKKCRVTKS